MSQRLVPRLLPLVPILAALSASCGTTRGTAPGASAGRAAAPFDQAAVERVLSGGPDPRPCAHEPGAGPYPDGYATAQLTIATSGKVSAAAVVRAEGVTPPVEACLLRRMRPWIFPPPRGGEATLFIRTDFYLRDWGKHPGEGASVNAVKSPDDTAPVEGLTLPPRREWTRRPGALVCQDPAQHRGLPVRGSQADVPAGSSQKKEAIRKVIQSHLPEVRDCYEQRMIERPYPQGRVMTRFAIDPDGHVPESCLVVSTVGDPQIDTCILDGILKWDFPDQRGGWTSIDYPFVLVPSSE